MTALQVASGEAIHYRQLSENNYALYGRPTARSKQRAVEVFNLALYLETFRGDDRAKRMDRVLMEIERMALETYERAYGGEPSREDDRPGFAYYQEAQLLVVTGSPDAIQVTSKIVNALNQPGGGGGLR